MDFRTLWRHMLSIPLCIVLQFGLEDKDIGRMVTKYPWILSTSIHKNLKEVLSFFDLEKVVSNYMFALLT